MHLKNVCQHLSSPTYPIHYHHPWFDLFILTSLLLVELIKVLSTVCHITYTKVQLNLY